jgi:hypothetical protein
MRKTLSPAQSRPFMYLPTYDGRLDASNVIASLLIGFLDGYAFGRPQAIDVFVAGPCFTVVAEGCYIAANDIQALMAWLSDTEDPALQATFQHIPALHFLRSAVLYSQFCLVDLALTNGTYRAAYEYGHPIGTAEKIADLSPRLAFTFTLPDDIFPALTLEKERLATILEAWRHNDYTTALPDQDESMTFNWHAQSALYYTLRIDLARATAR